MEEQQKCKCPAGIPAWVLTFADLMSLLMCFFVLLLSFAEMDVQKFKQIAGSMKSAFGVQRDIKAVEIPKGVNIVAKEFSPSPPQPTVINEIRQKTSQDTQQELRLIDQLEHLEEMEDALKDKMHNMSDGQIEAEGLKKQLQDIQQEKAEIKQKLSKVTEKLEELQKQAIQEKTEQLKSSLKEEIDADMIEVEGHDNNITIRIRDRGSFPPGTAELTEDFTEILEIIAQEISKTSGDLIVAGHTDDIPINSARFRSNWALSSARAVAVTHELIYQDNMDESRFSIQAFADSKPIVENDSVQNRAVNRRVEIIISQTRADLGLSVDKAESIEQQPLQDDSSIKASDSMPDEAIKEIEKESSAKLKQINKQAARKIKKKVVDEDDTFNSDFSESDNELEEPPGFIQF